MAAPVVIYRDKRKKNSWVRWLVARTMRKNNNNLISVIGKTGSGKTWSAMSISEMMSLADGVPFTIDHIVFSLTELMELINSGNLKRGSKIVCDEFQCSIGARDFQSEANKVFNYLISTFRHLNLTLFFCTPFETLLDKNTRRLFHGRFKTMGINSNNNTCRIKPRFIEYGDFKREPYVKQLIVQWKDKESNRYKSQKLFYWDIPKPNKELIIQYEKKKKEFTSNLNKNIAERLIKYELTGKSLTSEHKEEVIERKPLTEKQERVMRVFANIKENNKYETAEKLLGISSPVIYNHIKSSKKKGYTLQEFKEND